MNFDSNMPIYLQIMDEIKRWIVTDIYQPSQKIPSVRELAVEFGVNPNTVQRALSELERSGLVASERTAGRFICNDPSLYFIHNLQIDRHLGIKIHAGSLPS